ncbi:putative PAS/PAC sensor protein [Sulfurimonas denitrificans DSM 1251]|jgi:PAS domain S-box-containing protein|uniref:Putative PAS/PAC sensor protein n=1 Tax=Sulfurimonas denitrificans (strain ATCC 33889 / DSM 1251) TaxID=326298 RepID=Q30NS0_SULDN|nr:PAS domain-containing protein [Sulfurimonas denitrificans]ABB45361.1 putative PAS/PAC sensor protein [Sulfurimonas denitrificans DSM 1251]MDD3442588.1 PAS domain-containing protein [Sulfurimonas denitrificans]
MQNSDLIRLNDICFWNKETDSLHVDDKDIKLSISQKRALKLLIENLGKPVLNADIFYEVHDSLDKEFNEKSVRNLISGLRKLVLELNIVNIYGGYYMLKNENISKDIKFKEQLFDIVEQSVNPIVVTDPNEQDNPIIYVNNSFCELFRYKYEEVIGKNCRFLHSSDKEQKSLENIREAISTQKSVEVKIRDYTKDGNKLYEDITISPVFDKEKEKLVYFLGIYKDLTSIEQFLEKVKEVL